MKLEEAKYFWKKDNEIFAKEKTPVKFEV